MSRMQGHLQAVSFRPVYLFSHRLKLYCSKKMPKHLATTKCLLRRLSSYTRMVASIPEDIILFLICLSV